MGRAVSVVTVTSGTQGLMVLGWDTPKK